MNELEKKAFKVLEEINEDIEMEVTLSEEVLNEGMILNAITDIFSGKGENVADGTKEVDSDQIGTIKKNSRWFLRSLDYLIPGFSEITVRLLKHHSRLDEHGLVESGSVCIE